jgi:D-glycero-alpha-D-manno-heptose-7-phosphate kinase
LNCNETESVQTGDQLAHPIVRECLRRFDIRTGLDIVSVADIPGETGLGSSSSFAVGLLHALHAFVGTPVSPDALAAEACHVEIDVLGRPIGKQDQYIAAYGGFRRFQFNADESVDVNAVGALRCRCEAIDTWLMLFYTGTTRRAADILREHARDAERHRGTIARLAGIADEMVCVVETAGAPARIGELLHESWMLKRSLGRVTTPDIDGWYQRAGDAGAIGGKVLGAGGGGFLLVCAPPERQPAIVEALPELRHVRLAFAPHGSELLLNHVNGSPAGRSRVGTRCLPEATR